MNVLRTRTPSAGKGKLPRAAVIAAGRIELGREISGPSPRVCAVRSPISPAPTPPRRSRKKGSSYKSNEKHASHVGGDDMHPRAVTIQDPNPTIQDPDLLRRFAGGYPIKI